MEMITRAGLAGFHTAGGSNCRVAAPGSVTPAIGTNPIAFGFPTQGDPLILDMGTSAIMGTDLYYRARLGIPIPDDVALDKDGNPTTDAQAAVDGTILPFGGYKGFGLGLMVHAMNLLGSGKGSKGFSNGYMVMAIKPDLFLPIDEYRALLSQEIDRIKKTEKRPGFPEIRLPGERGFRERRKHLDQGIEIDRLIYDKLLALGARSPD
jgi:LDH2 family malate/lactate/ureidoglycolate dehydrogenase